MFIIRLVKIEDLPGVEQCSVRAGLGLTHLPKDRELLRKKIKHSINSFKRTDVLPSDEEYLFVLVDSETEEIGGTCGIYAHTGMPSPLPTYRIDYLTFDEADLPFTQERRILRIKYYQKGPSEICALYLLPEFRKTGIGKLLSLSRFLFMANHPHRFAKRVLANMRGIVNKGESPFWEGLGRKFVDLSFEEVMRLRAISDDFLQNVFQEYPVYVALLPESIRKLIGQVHDHTRPAVEMLFQQGFSYENEIDPVDGGPIIITDVKNVLTVKESRTAALHEIVEEQFEGHYCLISNTKIDFRACLAIILEREKGISLSKETAEALLVQKGDYLRYIKIE